MVMMFMKPSTTNVKFIASGSGVQALELGQYGNLVKMYWILKNLISYSYIYLNKTDWVILISRKSSTSVVKFMTPVSGVQSLGRGQ